MASRTFPAGRPRVSIHTAPRVGRQFVDAGQVFGDERDRARLSAPPNPGSRSSRDLHHALRRRSVVVSRGVEQPAHSGVELGPTVAAAEDVVVDLRRAGCGSPPRSIEAGDQSLPPPPTRLHQRLEVRRSLRSSICSRTPRIVSTMSAICVNCSRTPRAKTSWASRSAETPMNLGSASSFSGWVADPAGLRSAARCSHLVSANGPGLGVPVSNRAPDGPPGFLILEIPRGPVDAGLCGEFRLALAGGVPIGVFRWCVGRLDLAARAAARPRRPPSRISSVRLTLGLFCQGVGDERSPRRIATGAVGAAVGRSRVAPTHRRCAAAKRCSDAAAISSDISRTGVRSSRIQADRPRVPTTRSSPATTRSTTATVGMLRRSDCQTAPSSYETMTPRSVPR